MLEEINHAVDFICRLLNKSVDSEPLQRFRIELTAALESRFQNHWDIGRPFWGGAYRAINNFGGMLDPVLAQASKPTSIPSHVIISTLPKDLVLWVDPYSVAYRVGDHGNINTLFEDKSRGRVTLRAPDSSLETPVSTAQISAATLASQLQIAAVVAGYTHGYSTSRVSSGARVFAPGPRAVKISPPPSPPSKNTTGKMVAVN